MPAQCPNIQRCPQEQGLWTPASLRSSLSFWVDAADLSTITIATGVSEWKDKSGNARNISQSNTGLQPAYSATGFASKPGVVFDGTRYLFRSDAFMYAGGSLSAFAALRPPTSMAATLNFMVAEGLSTASTPIYSPLVNVNASPYTDQGFYLRTDVSGVTNLSLFSGGYTSSNKIVAVIDSGSQVVGYNNGTLGTSQNYTRGTTTLDRFCVGGLLRGGFTLPMAATIGEIIIVRGVVSDRGRKLVEGYLAWKWAIPSVLRDSHPFKLRPPLEGD